VTVHLTADDAGISSTVNHAILRACQAGYVTSVSFLVNLPAFEEARDLLGDLPIRRTAHLNAVEGRPLALTSSSPLVDAHGYFARGAAGLIIRHATAPGGLRRRLQEDLAREWAAQLERFVGTLGGPVNVDSHLHLHHAPFAREALLTALDRTGLSIGDLRVARESPLPTPTWSTIRHGYASPGLAKYAYLRWASGRLMARIDGDPRIARTPIAVCGVLTAMHVNEDSVGRFLAAHGDVEDDGYAEVILHPGAAGEVTDAWRHAPGLGKAHQSEWRALETEFACAARWREVTLAGRPAAPASSEEAAARVVAEDDQDPGGTTVRA
jgi:hypothetical protein